MPSAWRGSRSRSRFRQRFPHWKRVYGALPRQFHQHLLPTTGAPLFRAPGRNPTLWPFPSSIEGPCHQLDENLLNGTKRYFRDSKLLMVGEGPDEIGCLVIARRLLEYYKI